MIHKRLLATCIASAAIGFGSAANAQFGNVMLENWDAAPTGGLQTTGYTGAWDSVSFHSTWPNGNISGVTLDSIAEIRTDDANVFGKGTSNQILFLNEASGLSFSFAMPSGVEVATLSYKSIVTGFASDPDVTITNRFTKRFFDSEGDTAINYGLQRVNDQEYRLRNEAERYDVGQVYHFDAIVNNSADTITFNTPAGQASLDSGMTGVWLDGEFNLAYSFGRNATAPGDLTSFVMETFSNNPWSALYDEVAITEGAFVIPEPSTYALLFGLGVLGTALVIRRRRK